MLTDEDHRSFPTGLAFLDMTQQAADEGSSLADEFMRKGGKSLPATIELLGTVLSLMYRAAACGWGCSRGDHQVEWLCGRAVNQGMSAFRLIRAGSYDEALMLVRGIGEMANLLWLFMMDAKMLSEWKTASRGKRINEFGPGPVRDKLKKIPPIFAPIDDKRYRLLCEFGAHPVPAFRPGEYNHLGRPILGVLVQELGVMVTVNELSYATATCATAFTKLLTLPEKEKIELKDRSVALFRAIGGIQIVNLDEIRTKAYSATQEPAES